MATARERAMMKANALLDKMGMPENTHDVNTDMKQRDVALLLFDLYGVSLTTNR